MPLWSQKNRADIALSVDGGAAVCVRDPDALAHGEFALTVPSLMRRVSSVGLPLGSDCREHYERSVSASFDLNRDISQVDSHVAAVAEGAKTIGSLE